MKLPFLLTIPIPYQRFRSDKHNNLRYFVYKVQILKTYSSECRVGDFLERLEHIYLSSGYGKSRNLAALTCKLIREKKWVLYVPDCRQLLQNFKEVIQIGLSVACYESASLLQEIQFACEADDLIRIWDEQKNIYIIVDQLNALESDPFDPLIDTMENKMKERLSKMSYGQHYIFSAFADEMSNKLADQKQRTIKTIECNGGMNQVCLCFNGHV